METILLLLMAVSILSIAVPLIVWIVIGGDKDKKDTYENISMTGNLVFCLSVFIYNLSYDPNIFDIYALLENLW